MRWHPPRPTTARDIASKSTAPEITHKAKAYGDQMASIRFERDSFDVVHFTDGNWYIVDTGI